YARDDEEFVLKLATNLKDRGVPIWLDQWDIPPGANWNKSIDDAIYDCAKFLVVFSPAAVESGEVQGEWLTALDEKKTIVPVIHHACRIPRQLRTIQRVDFSSRGLGDKEALDRLVRTLGGQQASVGKDTEVLAPQQSGAVKLPPLIRNSVGMELVLIPARE